MRSRRLMTLIIVAGIVGFFLLNSPSILGSETKWYPFEADTIYNGESIWQLISLPLKKQLLICQSANAFVLGIKTRRYTFAEFPASSTLFA